MPLASVLFELFIKQLPLLDALEAGSISYHDHQVINGYDRQDLALAVEDYMADMMYAYEALLRAINNLRG